MPLTLKDVLLGGLVPLLGAIVTWLLLKKVLPEEPRQRFPATAAFVGAFCLSYWLLPLGPMVVRSHWHWLPYTLLMTLAVGPAVQAPGIGRLERGLQYLLVATVAGWLLVPAWETLEPSRMTWLGGWIPLVVIPALLLDPFTEKRGGPVLPGVWLLTFLSGAVVLALSGNLRFAQMLGAGAAAIGGLCLAACFDRHSSLLRGAALSCTVLLAGVLLTGRVNSFSQVPLISYLLILAAPLSLWCSCCGPISRLAGFRRGLVELILSGLICAIAVITALAVEWEHLHEAVG